MRIGILLSVREKATRFPGKVLKPLGPFSITEHLLLRLLEVSNATEVILATSHDARDEALVQIAKDVGTKYFQGSADDKLVRYRDAAHTFSLDFLVIVDGDDPFCSVEHLESMIKFVEQDTPDYIQYQGLPIGATGFGVCTKALERLCEKKNQHNTEVWQHLFYNDTDFRSVFLREERPLFNREDIRMTLDYPEDYEFFVRVANDLLEQGKSLKFANIMGFLEANPEVVGINRGLSEKYEEHLARSRSQNASRV